MSCSQARLRSCPAWVCEFLPDLDEFRRRDRPSIFRGERSMSRYSRIFSCQFLGARRQSVRLKPVRRCRRNSRMARACIQTGDSVHLQRRGQARQSVQSSELHFSSRPVTTCRAAVCGSGLAARIIAITSSMFATAMARPTKTWARSRALPSSKIRAAGMTSSRKSTKPHEIAQVHQPGTPAAQRQHVDAERCLQAGEADRAG